MLIYNCQEDQVSATYKPVAPLDRKFGIRHLQTSGTSPYKVWYSPSTDQRYLIRSSHSNPHKRKEIAMKTLENANHIITVRSIADLPAVRYMGMKNGWDYWRGIKTGIIYRLWG